MSEAPDADAAVRLPFGPVAGVRRPPARAGRRADADAARAASRSSSSRRSRSGWRSCSRSTTSSRASPTRSQTPKLGTRRAHRSCTARCRTAGPSATTARASRCSPTPRSSASASSAARRRAAAPSREAFLADLDRRATTSCTSSTASRASPASSAATSTAASASTSSCTTPRATASSCRSSRSTASARYVGPGEHRPSLTRLGTQEWPRAKARVRRAVAGAGAGPAASSTPRARSRRATPSRPTRAWQTELEASFPYVETPDQRRAIRDVKRDMEDARPMDRLVCGDVGYGKTEVAVRAAFKAVDGRHAGRRARADDRPRAAALQHLPASGSPASPCASRCSRASAATRSSAQVVDAARGRQRRHRHRHAPPPAEGRRVQEPRPRRSSTRSSASASRTRSASSRCAARSTC